LHRRAAVTIVHPDSTDTDMKPADRPNAEGQRRLGALGPYGRIEDIARMVVFLAGPGAGHGTGAGFLVDGGQDA
jgi:3-oxoacyl-[acyl-carrier protein] reductase